MPIHSNFTSSPAGALLSAFSSVTAASAENTEENDNLALAAKIADATLSFWGLPALGKAFIDAVPAGRKAAFVVAGLGVNGSCKNIIVKLAGGTYTNNNDNFDSLLIGHKGKHLFESYHLRDSVDPSQAASADSQILYKPNHWLCDSSGLFFHG